MDFKFSDEQRMLRNLLSSYLRDAYEFGARKAALSAEPGWRPQVWKALAQDLGVLGAALPEEMGGLGGDSVDTLVIMEEFGRALVIEPYLESVVIGAGLLKRIGTPQAAAMVDQIIAGNLIATLAAGEPTSRYDAHDVSTRAVRAGDGWTLEGRKAVVSAGPMADQLIVTARTSGAQRDPVGVSLFLVPKAARGVKTQDYATVDGRQASEIAFDGVALGADALLGPLGEALPLVELVLDEARVALCAEALGLMAQLVQETVEYAKQRRQFGRPIGDFQVLQHRMVDMFIQHEQAVSMTYMATLKLDRPAEERAKAVSAAKVFVAKACRFVGQNAVQTHGGIALTDELAVSHYFKRASMLESELGSVDWHLARYQAQGASAG